MIMSLNSEVSQLLKNSEVSQLIKVFLYIYEHFFSACLIFHTISPLLFVWPLPACMPLPCSNLKGWEDTFKMYLQGWLRGATGEEKQSMGVRGRALQ